jgi:hypothetical protein
MTNPDSARSFEFEGLDSVSLRSAVTCYRFGRLRPVATFGRLKFADGSGVKPPRAKAVTGHRTPNIRVRNLCRYSIEMMKALRIRQEVLTLNPNYNGSFR